MKRARATMDARKGRVNGLMSGRLRTAHPEFVLTDTYPLKNLPGLCDESRAEMRRASKVGYPRAMDDEMRAKVSALLEAVVTADGVIRPEERDFVRRATNRWKLPEPEAPLSLRTLGSATEALRALEPSARARILAVLVDAAAIDHDLDPREHALLLAAAAALGIEATALEERILQRLKAPPGP
jgi:uncharacterized tellurite resistance protein B-like protein